MIMEEHEHNFIETFVFDPEMHKTIRSERCICGYARNVSVHH